MLLDVESFKQRPLPIVNLRQTLRGTFRCSLDRPHLVLFCVRCRSPCIFAPPVVAKYCLDLLASACSIALPLSLPRDLAPCARASRGSERGERSPLRARSSSLHPNRLAFCRARDGTPMRGLARADARLARWLCARVFECRQEKSRVCCLLRLLAAFSGIGTTKCGHEETVTIAVIVATAAVAINGDKINNRRRNVSNNSSTAGQSLFCRLRASPRRSLSHTANPPPRRYSYVGAALLKAMAHLRLLLRRLPRHYFAELGFGAAGSLLASSLLCAAPGNSTKLREFCFGIARNVF